MRKQQPSNEFLELAKRGIIARSQGDVQSLDEVVTELGIKEPMTNKKVIEKIAQALHKNNRILHDIDSCRNLARLIMNDIKQLGYAQQPKYSEDLEQAIEDLAIGLEFVGEEADVEPVSELISKTIRNFLSANHLVQKAEDQSLPENPHHCTANDIMPTDTSDSLLEDGHYYGFVEGQQSILTPDKNGCVWVKGKFRR